MNNQQHAKGLHIKTTYTHNIWIPLGLVVMDMLSIASPFGLGGHTEVSDKSL